jgi:penicillin amidase
LIRNKQRTGCLVLLVLGTGVFILLMVGYRSLTGSLPETRGTLTPGGLENEVRVVRDGYSIPAVFAKNTHDLVFAQGYVTAQDRLWQMDLARRTAQGRLSEIFGRGALATDSLMRVIGLGRAAAACSAALPPASMRILRAYSDGVNAAVASHRKRTPVESLLLDYAVEPWTPADCIAVLRLHAFESGAAWITEPVRAALASLSSKRIPEGGGGRNPADWAALLAHLRFLRGVLDEAFLSNPSAGTFGFAVPGNRMESGKSVFAYVPCTGLRIPSPWYQAVLRSDSLNAAGLTIPGFPLVWAGHNDLMAWAPEPLDLRDPVFIPVTLKRADGGRILYRSRSGWRDTRAVDDTLGVRGDSTRRIRFLETEFGRVLGPDPVSVEAAVPALALDRPRIEGSDDVASLLRINRAGGVEALRGALGALSPPSFGWLFADRDGRMDFRTPGPPQRGTVLVRPGAKILAFADGRLSDGGSSRPIAAGTGSDSRIVRLAAVLTRKDTLSGMDIREVLTDDLSSYDVRLRDRALPLLKKTKWTDSLESQAFRIWSGWDGTVKSGSAGAALAEVFFERLTENAFRKAMGDPLYSLFAGLPQVHLPFVYGKIEIWSGSPAETGRFAALVLQSFRETVAGLRESCGPDTSAWNWGMLNSLTLEHPLGGQNLLRRVFNAGPFPMGGSSTTLDCWEHPLRRPFLVRSGPTARLILFPGDWDSSVSVISTGQSGQPMDAAHYKDQLQLLIEDCYHPDLWNADKISQSGSNQLTLKPGTMP